MAAPLLAPDPRNNTTSGVPWSPSYTGPRYTTRTVGQAPPQTQQGQMSDDDTRKWDQLVAEIKQALAVSSGWDREKKQLELEDAEKGRQNAYRIAELNDRTARYGIDERSRLELAQLKQNQKQFDATHGLELQKFGLNVADSFTKWSQTPDMIWAHKDFTGALGKTLGQYGVSPTSGPMDGPRAKTWEDFAALSGYQDMPAVQAGQSSGGVTRPVEAGGAGAGAGAGGGTDQRIKAMRAVADAMPPSDTDGADPQDWQALRAIESLYFARKPGSVESLGAPRRKTAQAGLARLGHDPATVESDYTRAGVGQGRARAA